MQGEVIIEKLSKTYIAKERTGLFGATRREIHALKDVSLHIRPGEMFGLLGPNGAGKTTLIKIMTTLLLPTSGRATINGFALTREDDPIRATVGSMLMGERGLYWKLTGRENLVFFGALYHLSPTERRKRANAIIERLDMGDIADRAVESYSSGQKMKLAFAKALINDAPLLILDEPTNTLDLPSARELRAIVRELNAQGKTVIYTTHIMAEAESLCDRVAIIDRGEVIAMDSVAGLKTSLGREHVLRVEGVISAAAGDAVAQIGGVDKVARAAVNGHTQLTVVTRNGHTNLLPVIIQTLLSKQALVLRIEPEEATLEDVFVAKTGRTLADDTTER